MIRHVALVGASLLALLGVTALPAIAAPTNPPGIVSPSPCARMTIPVPGPAGLPQPFVSGTLCVPELTDEVQVLVPGATYNSTYWNFPITSNSYVAYMTAWGRATFVLDNLNTGRSSKLPSAQVTIPFDAQALHTVIQTLKQRFLKIVLIGHSMGSLISMQETNQYHDSDGLIVTDATHSLQPAVIAALAANQMFVPAQTTGRLAHRPLGDLTTPAGHRSDWFYAPTDTRPGVVAVDEATKDVVTQGEVATFASALLPSSTNTITEPVLLSMGSEDKIAGCDGAPCDSATTLAAAEAHLYPAAASVDTFVLAGAGHDISLAANAQEFYANTLAWIAAHVHWLSYHPPTG